MRPFAFRFFFFNDTATTEIYTLSLHDALPILIGGILEKSECPYFAEAASFLDNAGTLVAYVRAISELIIPVRSEEHTSELQSLRHLVCRLLLEKKNTKHIALKLRRTVTFPYAV